MSEHENIVKNCVNIPDGPEQSAKTVGGMGLNLRLVQPSDAAYIHQLRLDTRYNSHLSTVTGDAGDQRVWIERYKQREKGGREYYFIIERRAENQVCGLVRLYDIEGDQFTWGSWILDQNKPPKAALESAFLIYKFAFERLGLKRSVFDVRRKNEHTLAFHRRFGAIETGSDDLNIYFEYPRSAYFADFDKYMKLLNAVPSH